MTNDVMARLGRALSDVYRIEQEIGRGGMATVFLARDLKHDRQVAIKVLDPDLAAALGADRFLAEIRTTAQLQHPHILPLLDSGNADGLLFYAMPFVRGETLRERLTREKQLPLGVAVRLAVQVAEALQHAHECGIVHRDVKPENILLQGSDALVADFGIALAVQSAGGSRMTQTGLSLGTPQYMAPEQAMGEREVDARVDIYALGAVLYEMLVGEPPFTGPTLQVIVAKVLSERPVSPRAVRDTVPLALERATLQALAKLPADRHASAVAFSEALTAAPLAASGSDDATTPTRVGAASSRPRGRFIAIGALLLVIGAALGSYWGRFRSRPVTLEPTVFSIEAPPGKALPNMTDRTLFFSGSGGELYFKVAGENGQSYMRRVFAEADAKPLPEAGNSQIVPSPDDGRLLVSDERGNRIVPVAPGAPPLQQLRTIAGLGDAIWTPAGIIGLNDSASTLLVTDPATGSARVVYRSRGGEALRWPAAVPGSDVVFLSAYRNETDSAWVQVGSLTSGTFEPFEVEGMMIAGATREAAVIVDHQGEIFVVPIDDKGHANGAPLRTGHFAQRHTGGQALAYARVSAAGDLAYRQESRAGLLIAQNARGEQRQLLPDTIAIEHPRVSPDGQRLLITVIDTIGNHRAVWQLDLQSGLFTRLLPALAMDHDRAGWTPDGKAILYRRIGNGERRYWRHPLDGVSQDMLVSPAGASAYELEQQPNTDAYLGRLIRSGNQRLLQWRGTEIERPLPFLAANQELTSFRFSPTGDRVSVSDTRHLYVAQFPSGTEWQQMDRTGARDGIWAPDGKSIYFSTPNRIWRARLAPQGTLADSRQLVMSGPLASDEARAQYDVLPDGGVVFVQPVRATRWIVVRNFVASVLAGTSPRAP